MVFLSLPERMAVSLKAKYLAVWLLSVHLVSGKDLETSRCSLSNVMFTAVLPIDICGRRCLGPSPA